MNADCQISIYPGIERLNIHILLEMSMVVVGVAIMFVCVVVIVIVIAGDSTGVGVVDDWILVPLYYTIMQGMEIAAGYLGAL